MKFLDDFSVLSDLKTHLTKLQLSFDKCWEFSISFNSEKCMFLVFSSVILGYIMSKEGRLSNLKKITAIMNMPEQKTPKDIQVFNNMAQFYRYFIQNFTSIMDLITKLLRKTQVFQWTFECQQMWEAIKQWYVDALILIAPRWDLEFHVKTFHKMGHWFHRPHQTKKTLHK